MASIRLYTPTDRTRCIEIFKSNIPTYFAEHELIEYIQYLDNDVNEDYYVLEQSGQIVACGGTYVRQDEQEAGLAWGMVDQNFHGKGYGRELTHFRIQQLISKYKGQHLIVRTSQHTHRFYEKMGFKLLKVTPNGWGEGLDKYEMELS